MSTSTSLSTSTQKGFALSSSKGFAPILIVSIIAALAIGGSFLVWSGYSNNQTKTIPTTQPVKVTKASPTPSQASQSATQDEAASWKTYTNTKYKISFKYPSHFLIATEKSTSDTYDIFFARSEAEKQEVKDCLQQMECYSYPFAFSFKEITKPPNKTLKDMIWDDSRADPTNFSSLYVDNFPSLQERISGIGGFIVYHTYVDRGQTAFYIQIDTDKSLGTNVTSILSTFKFLP